MESSWHTIVGITLGVGLGIYVIMSWVSARRPKSPKSWEEVGKVSGLFLYPLKSGKATSVQEAKATEFGLAVGSLRDRSFMVILKEGPMVSGRQKPTLTSVSISIEGHVASFGASGVEDQVKVDLESVAREGALIDANIFGAKVKGYDCGDEVSKWLSHFLYEGRRDVRVLYNHDLSERCVARWEAVFPQIKEDDKVLYADTAAYLLVSESSLADLNTRLQEPVKINRFRGNIVVSGSIPYDEDEWDYVRIGEVEFRRLKPCDRCSFTTVIEEEGIKDPNKEPLETLKKYRVPKSPKELAKEWANTPVFGSQLGIDLAGSIKVGEKVFVKRSSGTPRIRF